VPAVYILIAADHHAEKARVPDSGAQGEPTPA